MVNLTILLTTYLRVILKENTQSYEGELNAPQCQRRDHCVGPVNAQQASVHSFSLPLNPASSTRSLLSFVSSGKQCHTPCTSIYDAML